METSSLRRLSRLLAGCGIAISAVKTLKELPETAATVWNYVLPFYLYVAAFCGNAFFDIIRGTVALLAATFILFLVTFGTVNKMAFVGALFGSKMASKNERIIQYFLFVVLCLVAAGQTLAGQRRMEVAGHFLVWILLLGLIIDHYEKKGAAHPTSGGGS